jgi:hypothetical protein
MKRNTEHDDDCYCAQCEIQHLRNERAAWYRRYEREAAEVKRLQWLIDGASAESSRLREALERIWIGSGSRDWYHGIAFSALSPNRHECQHPQISQRNYGSGFIEPPRCNVCGAEIDQGEFDDLCAKAMPLPITSPDQVNDP